MAQNVSGVALHPLEVAAAGKLVMGEAASRFAAALPLKRPAVDPLAPMREAREEEGSAARAQVERSPELAQLPGRGANLKVLGERYAAARATVARDSRLSEVGKAERGAALHEDFATDLERLGQAYAADEDALLEKYSGKGESWLTSAGSRRPEDAARIASLAAVVPHWSPARALELIRAAVAERDRVVLQMVWPIVENLVESDPRGTGARPELEALRPDVELALGDGATDARDFPRNGRRTCEHGSMVWRCWSPRTAVGIGPSIRCSRGWRLGSRLRRDRQRARGGCPAETAAGARSGSPRPAPALGAFRTRALQVG